MEKRGFFRKFSSVLILLSCGFFVHARTIRIPCLDPLRYSPYEYKWVSSFYNTENLELLASKNDWTYEMVLVEGMSYNQALHKGIIDLAFDVTKTDEREKAGTLYSSVPVANEYVELFALEGDARFNSGSIESLNGARIGFYKDDPYEESFLDSFVEKYGLNIVKCPFSYETDIKTLLSEGKIDLRIMLCSMPVSSNGEKAIYNLGAYPVYFACVDPVIQEQINSALAELKADDAFYIHDAFSRVNGIPNFSYENLSEREIEFIKKGLPVDVVNAVRGLKFVDSADEEFWGKISDYSGLKFNFLKDEKASDGIFKTVHTSETEKSGMEFTSTVMLMKVRVFCSKSFEAKYLFKGKSRSFDGKPKIAITPDIEFAIPFFTERCIPFEYTVLPSVDECLEQTLLGKYDATFVDDYFLQRINDINDYPGLKTQVKSIYEVPVCFGVKCVRGGIDYSKEIASIINKTMYQFPRFYYQDIRNSLGLFEKSRTAKAILKFRLMMALILFSVVAFIALLAFLVIKAWGYRHKSYTDPLTGLMNNDGFLKEADKLLASDKGGRYVMTELNVRNFSLINQMNSSVYGDKMLVSIAKELSKLNSKGDVYLGRGFADSFYILHKAGDNIVEDTRHMQHLGNAIQAALSNSGQPAVIKGGCAFTENTDSSRNARELISRASYARKLGSSGFYSNFTVFDDQIKRRRNIEQDIEKNITRAFENGEFFVVYQPKISLTDGKIKGAEALVRWNSKDYGLVSPALFVPVFEQNGYVSKLDFFVYQQVFEYQKEQMEKGNPIVPISVNVSRLHQNPSHFVSNFTDRFKTYDLAPECIELEIVERFAGASDTLLIQMTGLLQKAGFKVNMDDFGSGESSLNMLSEIPVDVVKFDQRFLRQAQTSQESLIILRETMNLVRKLGKKTVCEGVETKEQVDLLKDMDCDLVQGFYYSKPLEKEAFTEYVLKNI